MSQLKHITIIPFLVLLIITGADIVPAFCQSVTGGNKFHIHNSMLGARSVALANTEVSDPWSLDGIYTNPAAYLYSEDNTNLSTNFYYNSRYNMMVENMTLVMKRDHQHLLAAGATMVHSGPASWLPVSTQVPVSLNQLGLSLHYASVVGNTLSIGGGLTGTVGQSGETVEWVMSTDFGLMYSPTASVSYGVAYRGPGGINDILGNRLVYEYEERSEGNEPDLIGLTVEPIPHQLEIGTTFRFPTISRTPNFKLTFANKKFFGESGLVYKAGLEIYPLNALVLRGGYFYHPMANGGRLGLGLLLGSVTLDYAFAGNIIGLPGPSHLLNISLRIPAMN